MTSSDPPPITPRRLRVRSIRRRTAAAGTAIFALAFGLIAGTGSLGATKPAAGAKPKAAAVSSSSLSTDGYGDGSIPQDESSYQDQSASVTDEAPAAVTTQQS